MNNSAGKTPWRQKENLDPSFPCRAWDTSMPNGFAAHWHGPLEMAYILKGLAPVEIDGRVFELKTGDIAVINSGIIHKYFSDRPGTLIAIFQFGLNLFDQTLVDLRDHTFQTLVFDKKPVITAGDGQLYRRVSRLLLDIRRENTNREAGFRLAIRSSLYALAMIFLRDIPAETCTPRQQGQRTVDHQKLEKVFAYIHNNAGEPGLTLEKTACAAAISKFHFTRFFREQTGQTFHDYLARVRVNLAEQYLVESEIPVIEVANICGFGSSATFNRLFKTYTGVSPSTYRAGATLPRKDAGSRGGVIDAPRRQILS